MNRKNIKRVGNKVAHHTTKKTFRQPKYNTVAIFDKIQLARNKIMRRCFACVVYLYCRRQDALPAFAVSRL
ncbi:MAG: hypothetical protein IKI11_00415 [Neisseriaceae bacterium]|nr:hypothetical protein [Neisseriaceae bacterium]